MENVPCAECGIIFGVPADWLQSRRADKREFYCPNGHSLSYKASEADILRRERDRLKQTLAEKDDAIRQLEREKSVAKGQITKMKKRAAHGVCPCCTRSFTNLRRHMETKHPTYTAEAAE
jgi:hypothetical protein